MNQLLYANLSASILSETLAGGAWSMPKIIAGQAITLKIRPAVRIEGAAESADRRVIHALTAGIGLVDKRPLSGTYQLKIGSGTSEAGVNVTASIDALANASTVASALNALSGKPCAMTVESHEDSLRVRFADDAAHALAVYDNAIWPPSAVVIAQETFDAAVVYDLRLVQAVAAQTTLFSLRTAQSPFIEEVRAGSTIDTTEVNAVQKIIVPNDFNAGSFVLRWKTRATRPLALPYDPADWQDKIAALADDGGSFELTEQDGALLIEFAGSMGGTDVELITVDVLEGPQAHAELTLDTRTPTMAKIMHRLGDANNEVKARFELVLTMQDEWNDEVYHRYVIAQDITLVRPLNLAELTAAADVNWTQPLELRSYKPWSPDQVVIGQRSYVTPIGDGEATDISIDHDLDRANLHVTVRQNTTPGTIVTTGFVVRFDSTNALTLIFDTAPEEAEFIVAITTADQPASFLAHTHEISEVNDLEDRLTAIEAAIAALQAHAPTGTFSVSADAGTSIMSFPLESMLELYPQRITPTLESAIASVRDIPLAQFPRDGGLLPAVHSSASASALPVPLEYEDANKGAKFVNGGDDPVLLPGRRGRRGLYLQPGELASYDGKGWYRIVQSFAGKNSFYPYDFERELFAFVVQGGMWPVGYTLTFDIGIELMLLQAGVTNWQALNNAHRTKAVWTLVIEAGAVTQDTSPSPVGANLAAITWQATPLLTQRLDITHIPQVHSFGIKASRLSESFATLQTKYSTTAASDAAITSAFPIAFRARLTGFDTLNSVLDPRGIIALRGLNADIAANGGISDKRGLVSIVKSTSL